jgi:Na+-transporting methylmalonyl-CoA/oxaloacetate decarboxylase gamma subunit
VKTTAFLSILVTILVAIPTAKAQNETNPSREACPWPENLDAVKAAENEHVRVLEVAIAPHSKEPIHTHCWPVRSISSKLAT